MFVNRTPFPALDVPTIDPTGRDVVVAILKVTGEVVDGQVRFADEPSPIRASDVTWDDEPAASIKFPSDVCVQKRGTDVIVVGHAQAPAPTEAIDVAIKVGERTVCLCVHGPRVFMRGLAGVVVGPAVPFVRAPLRYELAYGGSADEGQVVEARNPVGCGIAVRAADLLDRPAPRIDDPEAPYTRASAHPTPAGCGAIGAHWSPRREHAGTLDEHWQKTRLPIMPLDFDARFNNVAHRSLLFDEPLAPRERIAILGVREDGGVFTFELPELPVFRFLGRYSSGAAREERPSIDTVLVDTDTARVELTMRAAFPLGRKREMLRELLVGAHAG